jgi:(p)ppGpp synthase/HD superfamily hydrolase
MAVPPITDRYVRALEFALRIHHKDVRKGTEIPYVSHLLQVSGLVLEHGGDEDEAIGGLLHDTAEDGEVEGLNRHEAAMHILSQITQEFGEKVAGIVAENSDGIDLSERKPDDWKQRKEAYVAAISHKSDSALLVSMCDKLHNLRSLLADSRHLGRDHWSRFNAGRDEALWYYSSLLSAFQKRLSDQPRLARLCADLEGELEEIRRL